MDMNNLNDILSSLSDKDIDLLKQTAQSVFSSANEAEEKHSNSSSGFDFGGFDPAMIGKISRIMSAMNSQANNPGCDLLKALKPLLKTERQQRADQALQMMKLLEILPIIKELK